MSTQPPAGERPNAPTADSGTAGTPTPAALPGRLPLDPAKPCPVPGCVAGIIRLTYLPHRGGPVHVLAYDCDSCRGTSLGPAS